MMTTTIKMLMNLNDNDGLTLKRGTPINYKSGWQVADYGIETADINVAAAEIDTKKEALAIGRNHNQISIFGWRRQVLAYC